MPVHGDALRHCLGGRRGRAARRDGALSTAKSARPTASSRRGRHGSLARSAPTAWPRGSKVAMYLYNAPEYLETTFAAFKLRAVPVNVNYRYLADELHYLLDNADAEVLVYHGALGERVRRSRPAAAHQAASSQVETTDADAVPLAPGAPAYEDLIAAHRARAAHPALGRGPRLPLHRRHDRPAEGRHVDARRPLQASSRAGFGGGRRGADDGRGRRRGGAQRCARWASRPAAARPRRSCTAWRGSRRWAGS